MHAGWHLLVFDCFRMKELLESMGAFIVKHNKRTFNTSESKSFHDLLVSSNNAVGFAIRNRFC
jgi:hypothetical protein